MLSTTLSGNYGFPLCISGMVQQLNLSKEMADHDKRRKKMKRRRSEGKDESRTHVEEETSMERIDELWLQEMRDDEDIKDLVALIRDLGSWRFTSHTAKAA